MYKVVIDTNILISSRISKSGNPVKIMNLIINKKIKLCYNSKILEEYERVLAYKKFNFSTKSQKLIIRNIKKIGDIIIPSSGTIPLPDESDRIFYDTAKAADAYLITGNIKHYPEEPHILTPAQFVEMFED